MLCWLVGWFVCWLVGWLAGGLAGWLVGWWACLFRGCFSATPRDCHPKKTQGHGWLAAIVVAGIHWHSLPLELCFVTFSVWSILVAALGKLGYFLHASSGSKASCKGDPIFMLLYHQKGPLMVGLLNCKTCWFSAGNEGMTLMSCFVVSFQGIPFRFIPKTFGDSQRTNTNLTEGPLKSTVNCSGGFLSFHVGGGQGNLIWV